MWPEDVGQKARNALRTCGIELGVQPAPVSQNEGQVAEERAGPTVVAPGQTRAVAPRAAPLLERSHPSAMKSTPPIPRNSQS